MLNRNEFLIATALSGFVLLLVILNAVLIETNRGAQTNLAAHGQYIQQSIQVEPVYQGLIRTLAEAAAGGDAQIGTLLSSQGITFTAPARENGK